jgi:DNA-binding IclR family transcriptional regulator
VGPHPRTLYRVLRALASLGVFAEDQAQRFHLTPWPISCARTSQSRCAR